MVEHVAIWVWLTAEIIPGTDAAGDVTVWVVLMASVAALLAVGRKVISGPIEREQESMRSELAELTTAVKDLAHTLEKLITKVAVIEDRQKRIAHQIDAKEPE